MKVLLLGDYSSLGLTLKEALVKLDVDVTLAANGDGWKNLPGADLDLFPQRGKTFINRFIDYSIFPRVDKRFVGFDVVQCPGTDVFSWRAGLKPFENIINNNGKLFMNAAGVDLFLYSAWKNKELKYGYYMYDDNNELLKWQGNRNISSLVRNYRCKKIMEKAYGIIPVIPYEYEIGYKDFPNLCRPILLPINTDKIQYRDNAVKNKIVFFHGINRVADKGSNYIKTAMLRAEAEYPDDIECIIADRMPYQEYLDSIERANVILDQCKSYGYGMNALISMAKGKVVCSGAEKEVISRITEDNCPIYNIRPDEQQIYETIVDLIGKKNKIQQIGYESRKYVMKYHDYIKIAGKYLEEWTK